MNVRSHRRQFFSMAGFLSPLRVEELEGDDRRWRLLEPCVYHLKQPQGSERVEAPSNFITDFGSIPRPLWWVRGLSPTGRYRRAYVIHDYLFAKNEIRHALGTRRSSFSEANAILREAMHVLGANWFLRQVVWTGVTTGGWIAWNAHRRRETEAQAA